MLSKLIIGFRNHQLVTKSVTASYINIALCVLLILPRNIKQQRERESNKLHQFRYRKYIASNDLVKQRVAMHISNSVVR